MYMYVMCHCLPFVFKTLWAEDSIELFHSIFAKPNRIVWRCVDLHEKPVTLNRRQCKVRKPMVAKRSSTLKREAATNG
jgi:hypothetical protein